MFSLIRSGDITSVAWLETFKAPSEMEYWEMFCLFLIGIWIMEKGQTLNLIFLFCIL